MKLIKEKKRGGAERKKGGELRTKKRERQRKELNKLGHGLRMENAIYLSHAFGMNYEEEKTSPAVKY